MNPGVEPTLDTRWLQDALLADGQEVALAVLDRGGLAQRWNRRAMACWGPVAADGKPAGLSNTSVLAAADQLREHPDRTVEIDLGPGGITRLSSAAEALLLSAAPAVASNADRVRLLGRQLAVGRDDACIWDWNLEDDSVHYSEPWKALLGLGARDIGDSPDAWVSRMHPEDRDEFAGRLATDPPGAAVVRENEFRMRHQDGGWRWMRSQGRVVLWSPEGRPLRAIGTFCAIDAQVRHGDEATGIAGYQNQLFDALPANACVLDGQGLIIHVNRAWTHFGSCNEGDPERTDVGINYLSICDAACGLEAEHAHAAAAGIRAVIAGERERFHLVYPCHSPQEQRWYELRVAPIPGPAPRAVVIGHLDVTRLQRIEAQVHMLEHAIASANDGILIADATRPDHPTVFVNDAFERITGYRADEAVGHNCFFLQGSDDAQPALAQLRAALSGNQPTRVLLRNYRRNGEAFWNSVSVAPVFDIHGALTHHVGIMSDVSERVRTTERLNHIAGRVPGAIFHVRVRADGSAAFEYLSEGIRDLVGMSSELALAEPERLLAAVHPDDLSGLRDAVQEAGASAMPWRREFRVRLPDQRSLWIECSAAPVRGADGTVDWYGHAIDIQVRKQAEQLRERAVEELQQRNRDLQDFASIASHDLQEPLRKIQLFGDRLNADLGGLDPERRTTIRKIMGSAERMSTLIDDLLAYSRAGIAADTESWVALDDVLHDVTADLDLRIAEAGVELDVGPMPHVRGVRVQLRQVFQNLLSNAIKFRHPERPPRISIRCEPRAAPPGGPSDGDWVRIRFSDNGIGFPVLKGESLFAPFRRLHSHAEYEGTGIGLAIVRRIVERHGGRVTAEGHPGNGATFVVDLPVAGPAAD